MNKEDLFEVIKKNVVTVLVDIDPETVTIDGALTDFGANSVDRVEIAMYSMEDLNLKIPRVELGAAQNLNDLVEIFAKHLNA